MTILSKIRDVNNFNVGGGAASALAGSQGSGMIGMVSNLSLGKDYGLTDDQYKAVVLRAEELSSLLLKGAEADEEAFMKIRNAYKLPKATDFEKQIRGNAVQYGFVSAANTPLMNAYYCKEVYKLGHDLLGASNPNAETDLRIAIDLAKIGLEGCIANVEANISMIKDEAIVMGFKEHIRKLSE
jgi:formiminotetrahydrofolate cyclodeaminase